VEILFIELDLLVQNTTFVLLLLYFRLLRVDHSFYPLVELFLFAYSYLFGLNAILNHLFAVLNFIQPIA
jgi:hypothetical protein